MTTTRRSEAAVGDVPRLRVSRVVRREYIEYKLSAALRLYYVERKRVHGTRNSRDARCKSVPRGKWYRRKIQPCAGRCLRLPARPCARGSAFPYFARLCVPLVTLDAGTVPCTVHGTHALDTFEQLATTHSPRPSDALPRPSHSPIRPGSRMRTDAAHGSIRSATAYSRTAHERPAILAPHLYQERASPAEGFPRHGILADTHSGAAR